MYKKDSVLVVGTGTIGEPLIGILTRLKQKLDISKVVFHKRTPLDYEVAKVNSLVRQGAELCVDGDKFDDFISLGHEPKLTFEQALQEADVVIDCTPAGNANKDEHYLGVDAAYSHGKLFVAQGSEKGFGFPYAHGINDEVFDTVGLSRFVQVVSCNTHAMARLIKALDPQSTNKLLSGDFVCVRRSNDASQDSGFMPSPTCGSHSDPIFGTHHARDVSDLFRTIMEKNLNLTSSAMKVNSQYMHVVRFRLSIEGELDTNEALSRFSQDEFVSLTKHKTANRVFSFGRDHGFYGRIYNQCVVCEPSVAAVFDGKNTTITGFAFTPQDGNSLLSSVAACLYGLHDDNYTKYLPHLTNYLMDEI